MIITIQVSFCLFRFDSAILVVCVRCAHACCAIVLKRAVHRRRTTFRPNTASVQWQLFPNLADGAAATHHCGLLCVNALIGMMKLSHLFLIVPPYRVTSVFHDCCFCNLCIYWYYVLILQSFS